MAAKVHFQA